MSGKYKLSIAAVIVLTSAMLACSRSEWTVKWWPWVQRSECEVRWGKLYVDRVLQRWQNWCWVATVSEVLNWYHLPNATPCHLYDLVYQTSTCQAQSDPTWTPTQSENQTGDPEVAAGGYSDTYGRIIVSARQTPLDGPLSFSQIKEKICPADGSLGTPYIWAYDNGNNRFHDVVVKGYAYLRLPRLPRTGFSTRMASFIEVVDVHDPNAPLEPDFYNYSWYSDDGWEKEVMIANNSIWGTIPKLFSH